MAKKELGMRWCDPVVPIMLKSIASASETGDTGEGLRGSTYWRWRDGCEAGMRSGRSTGWMGGACFSNNGGREWERPYMGKSKDGAGQVSIIYLSSR